MNKFVEKPWTCDPTLARWGMVYAAGLAVLLLWQLLS